MPTTPQFKPEEAIVRLDTGRVTVDVPKFVVGLLRRDWNVAKTDGVPPTVDFAEVHKGFIFPSRDWITVYGLANQIEPVSIGYGFQNETHVISLDLFTGPPNPSGTRPHMMKMAAECERVLMLNRQDVFGTTETDLTGRPWLRMVRKTNFDKNSKSFYRQTIDFEVLWRYREIRT